MKKLNSLFLALIMLCARLIAQDFVYIVNTDSVSVLYADTLLPIPGSPFTTFLPVAGEQIQIAISPNGERAYVPGFLAGDRVSVFQIAADGSLTHISGSPFSAGFSSPFGVAVSPDGTRVYITNFGADTIVMFDADLSPIGVPVATLANPASVVISPDGSQVYVACTGASMISLYDSNLTPITSVSSGGVNPYVVAINPVGTKVYATNLNGNITSFDPDLTNPLTVLPASSGLSNPIAIAFDPDGTRIYVGSADAGTNTVSVLDGATLLPIIPALPSQGTAPYIVAVNPEGTRLFVSNALSNQLSVRDLIHNTYPPIAGSPFSGFNTPYGIAFTRQSPSSGPRNLSGQKKTNDFGLEFELFNLLTWESPSTGQVSEYCIYRNGVKIAAVNSSTLKYEDHNRQKDITTFYSVTSFDLNGNESAPVSITIN